MEFSIVTNNKKTSVVVQIITKPCDTTSLFQISNCLKQYLLQSQTVIYKTKIWWLKNQSINQLIYPNIRQKSFLNTVEKDIMIANRFSFSRNENSEWFICKVCKTTDNHLNISQTTILKVMINFDIFKKEEEARGDEKGYKLLFPIILTNWKTTKNVPTIEER